MNTMTLSQQGIDWLKRVEGQRLQPYDDQTGKAITAWVPGATVGYGHLIVATEWKTLGRVITLEEAEALLRQDLAPFEATVRGCIGTTLTQCQFDASDFPSAPLLRRRQPAPERHHPPALAAPAGRGRR